MPRPTKSDPTSTTLPERFQILLDARGLSARELAGMTGMPYQQVWRITSGKVPNPGVLTVQRIVEASGSTMAEFFGDAD
jgi:transcriptional regulator with XRE-family HTH domain